MGTEGANGELPGTDVLTGQAKDLNKDVTTVSAAINDPKVREVIQKAITDTNNDPSICHNNTWKIQYFVILPRDFSVTTDELTPSLKLKRSVTEKIWAKEIEGMYKEA